MRKLIIVECVTLDCVVQAPGGAALVRMPESHPMGSVMKAKVVPTVVRYQRCEPSR